MYKCDTPVFFFCKRPLTLLFSCFSCFSPSILHAFLQVTHANHQFDTDNIAARHRQNTKMNEITSARQTSDAVLDKTFLQMKQTNNINIKALAAEIIAPHDAKIAASKILVNAKSEVAATEFIIKAQLEVLTNQHTTALAEALATKTDDIQFRQTSLAVVKTTAKQAFDTDKILIDEYCKSTGDGKIFFIEYQDQVKPWTDEYFLFFINVLDLHKELTILTQINTKLGTLNPSLSSASSEEMSGATGNSE
jgi:hypothetical protein